MAVVSIADVIVPEILQDQIAAKYPDMLVVGQSGLVQKNPNYTMGSPGTAIKMPFWKRGGSFAAISEGVAMTTGKIDAGSEYALVERAGIAFGIYDTADLVTASDPHGEVSTQLARRAAEYLDAKLVGKCDKTPNTYSVAATGAGTVDQNTFMDGMVLKLGDNYQKMLSGGVIFMHSKVYGDLIKVGAIQNQYQSGMDTLRTGTLPTINGLPIFISDRVTTATISSVLNYYSYVVGPEALSIFFQRDVKVEFDRDILLQEDVIAATVHFAVHLNGWDDQGDAVAAQDNKSIHVVRVQSK